MGHPLKSWPYIPLWTAESFGTWIGRPIRRESSVALEPATGSSLLGGVSLVSAIDVDLEAVMGSEHVRRPGGITLLAVLGVVNGLASIGSGLFVMIDSGDQNLQDITNMSSAQLNGAGAGSVIAGVIVLVCALALGGGSSFVRWAYGIITMVNVSFGVWGLFALHGEQQLTAAFSLAFGLIILWILFGSERTDRFFEQH